MERTLFKANSNTVLMSEGRIFLPYLLFEVPPQTGIMNSLEASRGNFSH